jgi:prophage DNA circulation protein
MTCICIDDLRPASFRGVEFFVTSDKGEYGRRDVIHEYPMRDDPYIEDMGKKATKFHVSAYLFGDDWVSKKDALVAACTARGPAILQLPTEAPVMVACPSLSVSRSKDECGFYSVTMEFIVAVDFGIPTPVGIFESLIGSVIASSVAPFTAYFDQNYSIGGALPFVSDAQTDRIVQFATDIIGTVESSPATFDALSTSTVQTAISVYQNAAMLAEPDAAATVYLASLPIPAQTIATVATDLGATKVSDSGIIITSGASAIVPLISSIMGTLGNSMTPDDAVTALTPLATWSVSEPGRTAPTPTYKSPSIVADDTNAKLLCGMVRSFALMKLAQAISAKTFRTRQEAIQARANVVELFNMQIEEFSEDLIVNKMLAARDYAVQAITQRMASIIPILTINAPLVKPSLYWASRLYGDAYRAEELSDRNDVSSPAFMPVKFEALAR